MGKHENKPSGICIQLECPFCSGAGKNATIDGILFPKCPACQGWGQIVAFGSQNNDYGVWDKDGNVLPEKQLERLRKKHLEHENH